MSNVRDGDWFSQRAAEVLARLLHGPPSELALQFFVLSIQRVPTWRLATHGNACPSFRMNLSLAPDGSIARGLVVDAELVDHVLPDVVAVAAGPWLLPATIERHAIDSATAYAGYIADVRDDARPR